MSAHRRPIHFNPSARQWIAGPPTSSGSATEFHRQLPHYKATPLTRLDGLAAELGVAEIHIKDEGDRFGMPSFKILGASWGTFRAVVQHLGLDPSADLEVVRQALSQRPVTLYAATDGNHGRAVARMGVVLSIPVKVYVPAGLDAATIDRVRSEKATIVVSKGSYDDTVLEAYEAARKEGGILVQDTGFEGYEDIPKVCTADDLITDG
jgi:diaminopropionate ammonia-lyase family